MKFSMFKAVSAAAILAAGVSATSAHAAGATADAHATILASLSVARTGSLEFGTIAVNAAGAVTISNAGTRTACTGAVCSGSVGVPTFAITGSTGSNILITVPAAVTLNNQTVGSTATMSAALTTDATGGTHALVASESFKVGGTLNYAAAQEAGAYLGSFSVTVEYQ
jgi:Domain of unknown function (DUF4402)